MKALLAHINDEHTREQTLQEHLLHTATFSKKFENRFGNIAFLAGCLHDIGKATNRFQSYLLNGDANRGDVIHSLQGAFVSAGFPISDEFEMLTQEVLEGAIAKHHGDLPDYLSPDGYSTFFDSVNSDRQSDEKYHFDEVKKNLTGMKLDLSDYFNTAALDSKNFVEGLMNDGYQGAQRQGSFNFALGLYTKYVYSRLIDADRLDTAQFSEGAKRQQREVDWDALISRFESHLKDFDNTSLVNRIRTSISQQCLDACDRPTGIYRLSVPTGGGKTLASFRFALHHAQKTVKRRIIYVIPYLSITEQTSRDLRKFLDLSADDDTLLEHYSSAVNEFDDMKIPEQMRDELQRKRQEAAQRWDNPIIVTTMVQFLETVMSSHGTDLRKFHNMADSVIIFDEIQSLPINTIHLFDEVVSFLSKVLNTTVLLCTATQPPLEKTQRKNLLISDNPDLIAESEGYQEQLRRTNIIATAEEISIEALADRILELAMTEGSCLAIVNLKSEARRIYQMIANDDRFKQCNVIHLSTSMCGRHRRDQISHMETLLKPLNETIRDKRVYTGKPVICISTQLIEAGVDVSFSSVVRAMAGLDSIMQAAGRCNRSGESETPKNVYVYPIANERGLSRLKDIELGKSITLGLMHDYPDADLQSKEMLDAFYQEYFHECDKGGRMDYPMANDRTAYELLSVNETARESYMDHIDNRGYAHCLAQSFKTVSDNFHVISNVARNVVVHYGDSDIWVDCLRNGDAKQRVKALRKLQDYSVSLFDYEVQKLMSHHALECIDKDFDVWQLNEVYYKDDYGVVTETEMPLLMFDNETGCAI
ncbi:CRISPR-associated helicase Cas3' [Bifidobacterium sp. ESL0682]|uniref:CRISPR-associated helicase Cas3' n=1 Tax=Bifidobacterium sp. ESL0682 TaxID=2983212 RepID=UPI0023F85F8A|nr:CRISPR-associated helicase Cas3' [Bifidobacterium sp. ESL0682]WEV41500.1 CRISPR-associated helicase Cas3' [Bifidobacterium sp. ESL0682]